MVFEEGPTLQISGKGHVWGPPWDPLCIQNGNFVEAKRMVFEVKSERKKVPGKGRKRPDLAKISTPLSYNACFSKVPASEPV